MIQKLGKIISCFWCGIIFPLSIYGQAPQATFPFDHLTVDAGLSHNTVYALLEDHLGMIWMGTRFGLNQFDGYDFKVFLPRKGDEQSMNGHSVYCLWEDAKGNIWIGQKDAGISVFEREKGRFVSFPFTDDQTIDWKTISVRKIFQDSKGHLWIGTFGGGAVVFDQEWNRFAHFCTYCTPEGRRLSNDFVFDFAEDQQGRVWIATAGDGISLYDPAKDSSFNLFKARDEAKSGFGKSLCLDEQGSLWVGNAGNGLYSIDLKRLEIAQSFRRDERSAASLSHNMVTDLVMDDKGQIWIATDGGGLNLFSPQTGNWEQYYYQSDYPSSLNTDALYDLMWDTNDNLWIGTFNGGVNLKKAYPPPFETKRKYAVERDQGLRSVLCLDQGPDGELWLGTDGGGLYRLDVEQAPVEFLPLTTRLAKSLPEQVITSLLTTPSGDLWLGTFAQGLRYVDIQTGELRRFKYDEKDPQSLSHNNVWDLALSKDGGLWIGTLGGGVNYLAPGTDRFQRWGSNPADSNALSGVLILDVLLDADEQNLWIATENAGLNQLNLKTHVVRQYRYSPEDANGINSDDLRCLFEDDKGLIWIGTEHAGLNVLEPQTGQFDHFDMEDGLPSNMINSIVQSLAGNLWISTQAGIVSMDMQKRTFIDIGPEPYLTNSQYNPSAALRLTDGRLVFGSTNGYSLLNPTQLHINNEPPKVVFTDFSISGQSIPVGTFEGRNILTADLNDSLSFVNLSYQDKEINFKFAAIDYAQTSKHQYAYRLKNFDSEWHSLDAEQRFVSFSSLPGGSYVLEIKAANSDSVWSEDARAIKLIVAPPFWETWWFISGCILLGILLLIGSIIFALNRQKTIFRQQKLQAEREILRLKNENLEKDIAGQQAKLSASVLQIAHKNEILNSLKAQLKTIDLPSEAKAAKNLRQVLREINSELKEESYWDQFQLLFNQTHTHFVERLQKRHPQLSNNEKRLCCFIRMQLSNREIASILNVTINAVEQAKYRMKKKLNISKEDNLADYLRTIDGE